MRIVRIVLTSLDEKVELSTWTDIKNAEEISKLMISQFKHHKK